MDSKKLAQLCRDYADDKKAEDLVILDVRKVSTVTDYFVIASGTSEPHLRAIADQIVDRLRVEHGIRPNATDGNGRAPWQVIDFFDVIVHVMRKDVRSHYDLEGLWGDAPKMMKKSAPKSASRKKTPARPRRKPAARK